ncbi:GNAT family N-acetyltransferase [Sphingomonas crusticola]|uniref:GNAT family N-acetyltransferase n=1 Tax=Sphingomonas crusticola TaxID=1697973 RepID=UPI000E27EDB5|nr:GNAT family N-acetyltransferase [Sphingomonas crusticola]
MSDAGRTIRAGVIIRPARAPDIPVLEPLITASARALSAGFYSAREIEAAIEHVFGVDSDLVADGTYFVAEEEGEIVGCGGWSRQRTLFGGDRFAAREPGYLDPASEAARMRAFFVAPGHARKGVATKLLAACEAAAIAAGFTRGALMATLPGVPFYAAHGYRPGEAVSYQCGDTAVRFVAMVKELLPK